MPTHSIPYKVIYAFQGSLGYILEIKRTDYPRGTPSCQTCHWLRIGKDFGLIQKLTFVEMQDGELQVRNFKEGHLSFNDQQGRYVPKGEEEFILSILPKELSKELSTAVEDYLSTLKMT